MKTTEQWTFNGDHYETLYVLCPKIKQPSYFFNLIILLHEELNIIIQSFMEFLQKLLLFKWLQQDSNPQPFTS